MRFVLHSFCGLPLRAGIIIIGLFTTINSIMLDESNLPTRQGKHTAGWVIASIAFRDVIEKLLNEDASDVFALKEDWLNYMAVKVSVVFLLLMVCFLQLIGGLKESRTLIIPFLVIAAFLVCGLITDQLLSAILGIVNVRELRGFVSPAVTLLFFVWIDISYISELNRNSIIPDARKAGLLEA